MIDDGRDAVIGAKFQKIGVELIAGIDIDRDNPVLKTELGDQDRYLVPVRGRPCVLVII